MAVGVGGFGGPLVRVREGRGDGRPGDRVGVGGALVVVGGGGGVVVVVVVFVGGAFVVVSCCGTRVVVGGGGGGGSASLLMPAGLGNLTTLVPSRAAFM